MTLYSNKWSNQKGDSVEEISELTGSEPVGPNYFID